MQETWVPSLGWEDPLEEGMATYSSILAWRIPWTEEPGGYGPQGRKELDMTEQLTHTHRKHLVQSLASGSFPLKSGKKESPPIPQMAVKVVVMAALTIMYSSLTNPFTGKTKVQRSASHPSRGLQRLPIRVCEPWSLWNNCFLWKN